MDTDDECDIGLVYLAILMHKAGVQSIVLTKAEADAMTDYAELNRVSLVVKAHDDEVKIEFLPTASLPIQLPGDGRVIH